MNRIRILVAALAAVCLATPASAAAQHNLTFPDGDIVQEGLGDTGATVSWRPPFLVSSIASLRGPANCDPDSGDPFPVGETTVECLGDVTICPGGGRVCSIGFARGSFTVNVTRGEGPEFSGLADVSATAAPGRDSAAVDYTPPTATDPAGVLSSVCDPLPGSEFPVGDTTVTCTASDNIGNESSATFVVSVSRAAASEPGPRPTPPRPAVPGTPRTPGDPAAPFGDTRPVALSRLRLRGRLARIAVACPAGNAVACEGTLRLETRIRGRKLRLASKRIKLAPGRRATVRLRVGRSARRRLARVRRVRVKAIATTRDASGQKLTGARTFRVRAQR